MASNYHHLPKELIVEIMSRLPTESLIRCKCVCKSWFALINDVISDQTFVAKHLHNVNSKISPSSSLIYVDCHGRFSLLTSFGYGDYDENDRIRCVTKALNFPFGADDVDSLCHCDGIFCIIYSGENAVLFNPAIKESRVLPTPCFNIICLLETGFGYDPRANDYKVVRFGASWVEGCFKIKNVAEVYSMTTDCWKEIEMQIELRGTYSDKKVFCKGVFYWLVCDIDYFDAVLSFNMSDEVFGVIPLPNDLGDLQTLGNIELAVWSEVVALCFISEESEDPILYLEVRMMNDCSSGAKGSCCWVKHLRIQLFEGRFYPRIFWKNDELLMVGQNTDEWLVSYNLCSKKIRNVMVHGAVPSWLGILYAGSLVSVRRREQA
ncbi:Putative F-box protein [Morus notabilis]|uniref:Putative F-box protein n=1 Tax=Morus notabilis TaxID=981085 RepID=W9SBQ5_9ROSA|nr:putative F-box protein At3g16210 [Morus notabilis]EXC20617.1 Putative F-box protein [Morus notabilis]